MALRPQLEQLATATGQLTAKQVKLIGGALAEVDRLERRKTAILAAWRLLPDDIAWSRWHAAMALESGLKRIQGVSGRRILAGYRQPTALEAALLDMLDCGGPQCSRKLWDELRSLPATGQ